MNWETVSPAAAARKIHAARNAPEMLMKSSPASDPLWFDRLVSLRRNSSPVTPAAMAAPMVSSPMTGSCSPVARGDISRSVETYAERIGPDVHQCPVVGRDRAVTSVMEIEGGQPGDRSGEDQQQRQIPARRPPDDVIRPL